MGVFKSTVEILTAWFDGHASINEVTFGDITQVDITSETDFPLAHIIPLKTTYKEGFSELNFNIRIVSTYESYQDEVVDILDNAHEVLVDFVASIYNGTLFSEQMRVATDPSAEVVYDAHGNRLYGYMINVNIKVPAGIEICG